MNHEDHEFSGSCPTCGQKYCGRENERLRGALFGLVDKILEIEAHPAFSAVFSMAAVHGCPYTGPNYVDELDVARSLRAADEQKSDT